LSAVNEGPRHRRCEEDLAFFGRIGADVSHEMRNVLSIVGEYAGLMDDLLSLAKGRKGLDEAKLNELCAKITRQVGRGTEVMERFSRFAHAADEETASFDLASLVGNTAALARRRVALAGCTLEAELPRQAIPVRSNAFRLQHAVYYAIERVLESLESGQSLTIELAAQGPRAAIRVSGGAARDDGLPGRALRLSAVMEELGGNVETSREGDVLSVMLTIPTT
jgi:C4-dicarboxylate-specific signal transduction histidine kinase